MRWSYVVLPGGADSRWLTSPKSAHKCCHVHLDVDFIDRLALEDGRDCQALKLPPRVGATDAKVRAIAQMIFDEPAGSTRLVWETMAAALTLRLLRLEDVPRPRPHARGGLAPNARKRVTEYIAEHVSQDIALSELADLAGLSLYHFCRAFKRSIGLSPHNYQRLLRIERAKDLLTQTDIPIADVSASVGYEDQGHLARIFRNEVGISPTRFRRERARF